MGVRRPLHDIVRRVHASLGYYPARFPYRVAVGVVSALPRGWSVLDPFVGSGVACTASLLLGLKCTGLDVNPFAVMVARVASSRAGKRDVEELERLLKGMSQYKGEPWLPGWSRLGYWHPDEALAVLGAMWGYAHGLPDTLASAVLKVSLVRLTRELSYADPDIPKLYRGRRGPARLRELLGTLGPEGLWGYAYARVKRRARAILGSLIDLSAHAEPGGWARVEEWSLVDDEPPDWLDNVDAVFTSPPYLAAHEYTRSTKLELIWLGHSEEHVRKLARTEVPYAPTPAYRVESPTYKACEERLSNAPPRLQSTYRRYFWAVTRALDRAASLEPKVIALFVGDATVAGLPIPIHRILAEHLEAKGYHLAARVDDPVKTRKLFRGRRNKNPNGIRCEHLVILARNGASFDARTIARAVAPDPGGQRCPRAQQEDVC